MACRHKRQQKEVSAVSGTLSVCVYILQPAVRRTHFRSHSPNTHNGKTIKVLMTDRVMQRQSASFKCT